MLHNWISPPRFLRNQQLSLAQKSGSPPLPVSLGMSCDPLEAHQGPFQTLSPLAGLPRHQAARRGRATSCASPGCSAAGEQGAGRFYCIAGFCSTLLLATIEFAAVEAGAGTAGAPSPPAPLQWDRDLVWVPRLALGWVIRCRRGSWGFVCLPLSIPAWSHSLA